MVTQRLAALIGAPVCLIALYDAGHARAGGRAAGARPARRGGARASATRSSPNPRSLWNFRIGPRLREQPRAQRPAAAAGDRGAGGRGVGGAGAHALGGRGARPARRGQQAGRLHRRRRAAAVASSPGPPPPSSAAGRSSTASACTRARLERVAALVGEHGRHGRAASALLDARHRARAARPGLRAGGVLRGRRRRRAAAGGARRASARPARRRADARAAGLGAARRAARCSPRPARGPRAGGAGARGRARAGRAGGACARRARPSATRSSTCSPRWPASSRWPSRRRRAWPQTERLAAQMATLYDLGLETGALRDLRLLFAKATEEAGRLIRADHASVLRLDQRRRRAAHVRGLGARSASARRYGSPVFRLGEGVAGRVARDRVPAHRQRRARRAPRASWSGGNPVSRLMCVPLLYYDQERQDTVLFGVLNATRAPGAPAFTHDDLEYLTRFAGQLSIAVANSMAFAAERERSEQLALVNTLLREIGGQPLARAHPGDGGAPHPGGVPLPGGGHQRARLRAAACTASWPWPARDAAGRRTARSFPLDAGITGRAYREQAHGARARRRRGPRLHRPGPHHAAARWRCPSSRATRWRRC